MNILVTGFKPFGGSTYNMTERILTSINIPDVDVVILDVLYEQSFLQLKKALTLKHYDMIVSFGEAPIKQIQLEYLALNIMHARIPDAKNFQPLHIQIESKGPQTLPSLLPLKQLELYLTEQKIPYQVSYHAGTYVCNDIFYRLLHDALMIPRGFIHIPNEENTFDQSKKAIEVILQWLLT